MYAAVCDYFMKNVGKIKEFQLDFLFVYFIFFYLFIYLFPQKASGAACPTCKPLHTSMGEIWCQESVVAPGAGHASVGEEKKEKLRVYLTLLNINIT